MVCKFLVYKSEFNHWNARENQPARDDYSLLALDMSEPAAHRLSGMLSIHLDDGQREQYFEKIDGKMIEVAVFQMGGKGKLYVRGKILGVSK